MSSISYRFSRHSRLLQPADFQRVFDAARRSGDTFFTILYRDNDLGRPRLGFTVAKKKIPSAVGRNRIRRLARESFRQETHTLGAIDIIILAQNKTAQASNQTLFASLESHWRNLKQRKDQSRRPRRSK